MSTIDVLALCENVKLNNIKKKNIEGKDVPSCTVPLSTDEKGSTMKQEKKKKVSREEVLDEKPAKKTIIYAYDNEILLELRSAPDSLKKPDCLSKEFFNKDGVWDPESWHKSNISRSASPAVVDGESVVVEGKKLDLLVDDNIKLAPHSSSFRQGCRVQPHNENEKIDKPTGTRAMFEKKNRLTGRAAGQRRSMENTYKDRSDSLSERTNEFEKLRRECERFYDKEGPDKQHDRYNERYTERYNDRRSNHGEFRKERHRTDSYNREDRVCGKPNKNTYNSPKKQDEVPSNSDNLPEWMTDGPTSQSDTMEFTGFKDIEEEKKAYAKRKGAKKVRISPDVMKQEKHYKHEKDAKKSVKDDGKKRYSGKSTPTEKMFDINEFFNEVDYYPPHLFHEDMVNGDGVKSRFTRWFQNQASRSSSRGSIHSTGSRPGSAPLLPDEVFTGVRAQSPVTSAPYFTPIQPAPDVISATATAHDIQISNILNIIQKQKSAQLDEDKKKENKQVKGRLTLEDLELHSLSNKSTAEAPSKSAFDMLVKSMKDAGQLPDKPAPVVTGLPDHLLPKPPQRKSPCFEKLKRSLSRSPSPVQLMKAVSTVASIITSNPNIELSRLAHNSERFIQPVVPKALSPSQFFNQRDVNQREQFDPVTPVHSTINARSNSPFTPGSQQNKVSTAFLPTSVLKKMHNEKQHESPTPLNQSHPDESMVSVHKQSDFHNLLAETKDTNRLNSDFNRLLLTPERLNFENSIMPFHSAPATPRHPLNTTVTAIHHSASAPGTPEHRFKNEPPNVQRLSTQPPCFNPSITTGQDYAFTSTAVNKAALLLAPSAFQSSRSDTVGVIGSGMHQKHDLKNSFDREQQKQDVFPRGFADPRLAPGNGAVRSNSSLAPARPYPHSTPQQSQQQQLLQAQRMAQIQQAQILQQQKLQQIANQANRQNLLQQKQNGGNNKQFPSAVGIRPLLPDPDRVNAQSTPQQQSSTTRPVYQQQQHQQIQAYQQQQLLSQQQSRAPGAQFPNSGFRGRLFQTPQNARNSLPVPIPMQQPSLQAFNNLKQPQGMPNVNLAAQAMVQQQLFNQAARARFLAQAQLLQQPHMVQAALMAQAALARGQAQAQAAIMLNPRNIQAMAEQMGIRPPNNKAIPTPMVAPHNVPNPSPVTTGDTTLSKWFGQDVLQNIPQNKTSNENSAGKIMSVEELERTQRNA